jgi:hypothetical protein
MVVYHMHRAQKKKCGAMCKHCENCIASTGKEVNSPIREKTIRKFPILEFEDNQIQAAKKRDT